MWAIAVAAVWSGACGGNGRPARLVPVTVLVSGDAQMVREVRGRLNRNGELPVELRFDDLPNEPTPPAAAGDTEAHIAAARVAYIASEPEQCLAKLDVDTGALLAAGRRTLAARVLLWRFACRVGADERSEAERIARQFAVFGLDVPPDVGETNPEVEILLSRIMGDVAGTPRESVEIDAAARGARIAIDGRSAGCVTPCTIDLPPGDHVVRIDADGFAPAWRVVRVKPGENRHAFELTRASPDRVARQWTSRYADSPAIDGVSSMRLLARAVRGRRVVLLAAHRGQRRSYLRGVLAVDGDVLARAERHAGAAEQLPNTAPGLMRELLVRGKVVASGPPLHKRPVFWVAVGIGAAVAAAITGVMLYEPGSRQVVGVSERQEIGLE